MAVRSDLGDDVVTCSLVEQDGRVVTIGSFALSGGNGDWAAPLPGLSAPVTGARLVDSRGATVARATL